MDMLTLKSTPECSWHDWRAHTLADGRRQDECGEDKRRCAPTLDADLNGSKL
jgi:hypothetical protein